MSAKPGQLQLQSLIGLRMPRALEGLDATLQRFEQGDSSTLEGLGEEFTPRETRRIKMALQTARRGTIKTLARYDFSFQPSLERDRVMARAQLEWIARRQTGHFMGPPGSSGRRAGRRGRAGGQKRALRLAGSTRRLDDPSRARGPSLTTPARPRAPQLAHCR